MEDRLRETDSLRQALKLEEGELRGQRPVVSAVGAGGKTTTLHRLADEYVRAGVPVLVTTTTHIMKEDREWFLSGFPEEKIEEQLQKAGQAWVGEPAPGGKLGRLPDAALEKLLKWEIPDRKDPGKWEAEESAGAHRGGRSEADAGQSAC